jgi:hypothetical protein
MSSHGSRGATGSARKRRRARTAAATHAKVRRNESMWIARAMGHTLSSIARFHGVSVERARQVIAHITRRIERHILALDRHERVPFAYLERAMLVYDVRQTYISLIERGSR